MSCFQGTYRQLVSLLYLCARLLPMVLVVSPGIALAANTLNVRVVDTAGNGIADVAVYLQYRQEPGVDASAKSAVDITQKNKSFKPYLGIAQRGAAITFSNRDDITHHIYSVTGPERFSFTIRSGEVTPVLKVDKPGVIAMGCNIHDWMSGYLLVVDTPYYGVTDSQGNVLLTVDEANTFNLMAWHPQVNESLQQEISIPNVAQHIFKLNSEMAVIPQQSPVDDFDFLEGY